MKLAVLETDALNFAKDVRAGIEDAGADAVKLATFLQNNSSKITALASLAGPEAAAVVAAGTALTNLAITAVKGASAAAKANGISVTLDQAAIAQVEAAIAAIEKV
jgi:hypothetical protein